MIRVGVVGVGNCADALVRGVHHYKQTDDRQGLMHPGQIGGYDVTDIAFSSAFDVNEVKVGRDLREALDAPPNNGYPIEATIPHQGVTVQRGPLLDGLGRTASTRVLTDEGSDADSAVEVITHLLDTRTEVLVNFLPVGSTVATEAYAYAALAAGCAFVNAIPVPLARRREWRLRFADQGVPLIGDDVKSQVGATITHRELARLFSDRGIHLDRTYQLNVGGNMDFLNMLDEDRLTDKRASKTSAVQAVANSGTGLADDDVHIGPSDYVPWLGDRKVAFIRLEGTAFGGVPLEVEMRMNVWDSPNSAGVVVDAVRYAKAALDRGTGGVLEAPSAWMMKAPPTQMDESLALAQCDAEYGAMNGHVAEEVQP